MIHHLARAFFVRNTDAAASASGGTPPSDNRPASAPAARPVKARPITPWTTPARQPGQSPSSVSRSPLSSSRVVSLPVSPRRVRICTDPADARRTVIAGRFAEVCAALDRLVMEQEAIA